MQHAINRMHTVVLELQEANRDVLLGKRNLNCLSCGVKDDKQAELTTGTDGRLYRGNLPTE